MNEDTAPEQWRAVVGWEGFYEVSDQGRVRSVDRVVEAMTGPKRYRGQLIVATSRGKTEYLKVGLKRPGQRTLQVSVHTLVLTAFSGPRPHKAQGCHNDGNRTNNYAANLRWDTNSSNQLDRVQHGRHYLANRTHCIRNHELVPPNITGSALRAGYRQCKACQRALSARSERRRAGIEIDVQALADWQYARIMSGVG